MSYIFIALLTFVLIGLVLWVFVNSDAKSIVGFFQLIIPVSLLAFGIIATIAGRGQIGIPAMFLSIGWWYFTVRKS